MSLKQKIITFIALTLLLLSLKGLDHYDSSKIGSFGVLNLGLSNMQTQMLTLRRNEKDFLSRNELKYQEKFIVNFDKLINTTKFVEALAVEKGFEGRLFSSAQGIFNQYLNQFNAVIEIQKTIGLNPKDGLYGRLRKAVNSAEETIIAADDQGLRADMLQLRRNEKDFMLRHDLKYLDKFDTSMEIFNKSLAASKISNDQKKLIRSLMTNYRKNFHALVEANVRKGLDSKSGLHGDMRTAIHQSEALLVELITQVKSKMVSSLKFLDIVSWVLTLFILTGIFGVMFWVIVGIQRPMQSFVDTMQKVTKTRDLSLRVNVSSNDQIGKSAVAFNSMMGDFQDVINVFYNSSVMIANAAAEIAEKTAQTSQGVQTQQEQTRQLSASTSQMAIAVDSVANNVGLASDAAKAANKESAGGKELVAVAGSNIIELADNVNAAFDSIGLVEEGSNNIGKVVDVIKGIAEQTNLLALNAAIEAARAGEQGRGFAVVADEVRTLASRTQESTSEIQTMIEQLQARSKKASQVMAANHTSVQTSVEQTSLVNGALSKIDKAVEQINIMNYEIVSATQQQRSVTDEALSNVIQIETLAEACAVSANEISISTDELTKLASELKSTAAQFIT